MTKTGERLALITGGAGFIATNVADRLLRDGWRVRLFDNFSRAGVAKNVEWLQWAHAAHPSRLETIVADVRDLPALRRAAVGTTRVFHFAAQVAVTTSLNEPRADFDVNAGGTLNLLEALRELDRPPSLLFTSTNKVYGALDDVRLRTLDGRYEPDDAELARHGVGEHQPLDFHSPYGCSKGAADQYVLDYARTFSLPATVFRMSCIYGPHQCGTEDQGWVAHFVIQALRRQPLALFGDGRQVRDVLYADDLVAAMMLAHERIDEIAGQAFNIGGGPMRTTSLLELIDLIGDVTGKRPAYRLDRWRRADQRYYVSDTRKFQNATGWAPQVSIYEGLERLAGWLGGNADAPVAAAEQVAL